MLISKKQHEAIKAAWEKRKAITHVCPHCGYTCSGLGTGPFKRFHGDRCKYKLVEPEVKL